MTRFMDELRQLRNGAGLGHAELAARAHYPYDLIRAAEVGPSLPDLPVLSAFVRGCGGTVEEVEQWEERWRSLTRSPSLPLAATRPTGQSDAADAGARISSAAQAGEGPDPSIIMAALNRVAEEMSNPAPPPEPAAEDNPAATAATAAGWDPIRVSSAWPALAEHPPAAAGSASADGSPAADGGPPAGVGAPWGEAPWAGDPAAPAPGTADRVNDPGVFGAPATPATSTAGAGPTAAAGGAVRPSRTMLIAAGVVLLCVLAVLLAFLL